MWWCETSVGLFDANLLVDGGLFVLDLLLEVLEGGRVGRGVIGAEDLDIFIGEGVDLLLFNLVVGKLLLVLLPVSGRGC